jgi:hypothetical protein
MFTVRRLTKIMLYLVFAISMLGCGLTGGLQSRLANQPVASGDSPPTRTPWPTFTPPATATLIPLPTETPTPAPTDTPIPPTETPALPTDTPPPPTNTPAPPPPAAEPEPAQEEEAPPPAEPEQPQYQFTPDAWYGGDRNDAIGRFYGHMKDKATGAMVNGYCVRASCGSFSVLSFPSGPSGVAPDWAAGWYDIVIVNPVTCNWTLQVVEYQCEGAGFDAQCTNFNPVSEAVAVTTDVTAGETIVVADWLKNW